MTILSFSSLSWRGFVSLQPLFRVRYAPSSAPLREDFASSKIPALPRNYLQSVREDYLLERRFIL